MTEHKENTTHTRDRESGVATIEVARDYKDLQQLFPVKTRLRSTVRDITISLLSTGSNVDSSKRWIWFPYYHHVFDDERDDFERQLRYMRDYGDFISLDTVVDILHRKEKIDGRYFCVTFDDGFKNCVSNALSILVENECPATFFIATDYIGCDIDRNWEIIRKFFESSADAYPITVEFLNWDDCRELLEAGMTIGAHTCSHVPLIGLDGDQLKSELVRSKEKIEKELGINCIHFACPWGIPEKHFKIAADPAIVKQVGYRSFLTTARGPNYSGTDPFKIRRDHMLAKWGNHHLRYFFSRK